MHVRMCVCVCVHPLSYKKLVMWCGVIWTSYDWLNKFCNIYMAAIVGIISKHIALKLKCVVETNLIRVSYCCISCSFHFNSYLKQLYISNKTERFSYKVDVVWRVLRCLEAELAWAIDWLLRVISYTTKKLKNKVVLN